MPQVQNEEMEMSCDCIDYPVSWTYWRDHCIVAHGYDPGPNEIVREEDEGTGLIPISEAIRGERKFAPDLHKEVAQLKGQVLYLLGKEAERKQRRPKGRY